jgi:flagellar biosynthesis protein FlhF
MITRTFRAETMPAALEAVQRDLGADALILSARHVLGGPAWQVWRQPVVEVVAMVPAGADGSGARSEAAARETLPSPKSVRPAAHTTLPTGSAAIRFQTSALSEAYRRLAAQGVDDELARKAVLACAEVLGERALQADSLVRDHVRRELAAGLAGVATPADRLAQPEQVICLVGPSGSGKTTTAAKLAAHYTTALGQQVAWLCADTIRAGAVSQARAFASTLKLPLRVAYTPEDVAQAAAAEADADLILMDTPGCNPRREAELIELGALLTALPNRTTYLVLPATAKEADLNEALSAFGVFGLSGLVISKLDETGTFGNVFNVAWRSRLPLAYFATGPDVLEDLQPGRAGRLVAALLGEAWSR